ncbi:XRE family transcriptional regulator [Subdoligranulum sp. AM23-21AC]|nr:helix-turn-helix transcriptional regulator [Ruthenibacterium lactatiformans]MBN3028130.1 helix-turn-helix transcriptional regulator [Ruthenibacterium lactatiformans]RGD21766.1 XRE family transcriptional regulator [Subdoligranulum sp. AM23-21AC]
MLKKSFLSSNKSVAIQVLLPHEIVKLRLVTALFYLNILSQTPLDYKPKISIIKIGRCAMVTVGTRLRIIRKDAGLSQVELGKLAGSNQSAINRYETDRAAVPYRMLIWYAQYFDVSMDYIFGLCDDKRGRIVTVSPEGAEEYVRRKPDWSEFVEACFEPGSELNRKLKQMVLNMAEEHSHGVKEG